jgi:hypothetical protein
METATGRALELTLRLLSEPPDFSALADPAGWKLVKQQAVRLGVAPLIAYLTRPHLSGVEREWCDRVLTRSWMRHDSSLEELRTVLRVLYEAGVTAVPLKGPVVARRYYRPYFLRKPATDLDIAVRQNDLPAACGALHSIGYAAAVPDPEALACSHHVVMLHRARMPVELHFRLSHGPLGIPADEFIERSVPSPVIGDTARMLTPADEALQLILHLGHDRFRPIFHLYEVRKIWRGLEASVQRDVLWRAAEHRLLGVLALTEIAFRLRWGESFLPPDFQQRKTWLHWRIDEKLYTTIERSSISDRALTLGNRLQGRWLQFQTTDGPSDAMRLVALMVRISWFQLRQHGWRTVTRQKSQIASRPVAGAAPRGEL